MRVIGRDESITGDLKKLPCDESNFCLNRELIMRGVWELWA